MFQSIITYIRGNWLFLLLVGLAWLCATILLLSGFHEPGPYKQARHFTEEIERINNDKNLLPAQKLDEINYIAFEYPTIAQESSFAKELKLHAAIALYVAGLLIVSVELHTRHHTKREFETFTGNTTAKLADFTTETSKRFTTFSDSTNDLIEGYRRDIAADVWRAVSGRLVRNAISKEIDFILKSDVVMQNRHYTLQLGVTDYDEVPSNLIVVRRTLWFTVRNISGRDNYPYKFSSAITNPMVDSPVKEKGNLVLLPRHRVLKVGNTVMDIPKPSPGDSALRELSWEVKLPKNGTAEIYTEFEELCRLTDTQPYGTNVPIENLSVRVIVRSPRIELISVYLHHPRSSEFRNPEENFWILKGGVLPGQAFVVHWREIDPQPSTPPLNPSTPPLLDDTTHADGLVNA